MAAVTAIRTIIRPARKNRDPSPPAPISGHGGAASVKTITTTTASSPPSPSSHRHHDHHDRDQPHRHHHRCARRPRAPSLAAAVWAPPPNSPATEAMAKIEHLDSARDRDHEYRKETAREFDFVAHFAQEPHNPRLGKPSPTLRIDDFELLKTLGTGTFARVRLAKLKGSGGSRKEDPRGCSVFALKILRKVDIIKLKQVEHVRNERLTLGTASGHPFVTTLITTFVDNESLYMLLDYCPGGEVFTYLRRAGRFPEPTARFYAAEIVLVLEHLHDRGIAYRDLKPENMLLDGQGHLKLVDFGFAKMIGKTETYTLCGTPEYLAPEVIHNTGHGTAVDWWALGILLYEFLVGQPPFWDPQPMQIYHKIVHGHIPFPPEPAPPPPRTSAHHASSASSSHATSSSSHAKITMTRPARDLISRLCTTNPSARLGHIAGGARRVRGHAFFDGVDWAALRARATPGPVVPKVQHAADTGNFDDYPEPPRRRSTYSRSMREEYEYAFRDF